jgi:hypothetical protein
MAPREGITSDGEVAKEEAAADGATEPKAPIPQQQRGGALLRSWCDLGERRAGTVPWDKIAAGRDRAYFVDCAESQNETPLSGNRAIGLSASASWEASGGWLRL